MPGGHLKPPSSGKAYNVLRGGRKKRGPCTLWESFMNKQWPMRAGPQGPRHGQRLPPASARTVPSPGTAQEPCWTPEGPALPTPPLPPVHSYSRLLAGTSSHPRPRAFKRPLAPRLKVSGTSSPPCPSPGARGPGPHPLQSWDSPLLSPVLPSPPPAWAQSGRSPRFASLHAETHPTRNALG